MTAAHPVTPSAYPHIEAVTWDRLPEIDLYMDQVLGYVTRLMGEALELDQLTLTPAMVNRCIKTGLLPAPKRKQYSRVHVSRLLIWLNLRAVFSTDQILRLFQTVDAQTALETGWIPLFNWFMAGIQKTCKTGSDARPIPKCPSNSIHPHWEAQAEAAWLQALLACQARRASLVCLSQLDPSTLRPDSETPPNKIRPVR